MADEYDIQQSLLEQDEEFLMQNRQYTSAIFYNIRIENNLLN